MISRSGTLFQPRRLFLASGGVLRPQEWVCRHVIVAYRYLMPHMGFGERGNGKVNLDPTFRSTKYPTLIVDLALDQISKITIPATFKTVCCTSMHELYIVHKSLV